MANQEHVDILRQGVEVWNKWREKNPYVIPLLSRANLNSANLNGANLRFAELMDADLTDAYLSGADLTRASFSWATLSNANLSNAYLNGADLTHANFSNANLSGAGLGGAKLRIAIFSNANLSGANLREANLSSTNFSGANFIGARLVSTLFGNIDLRTVKGLEMIKHDGPSTIGIDTILKSEGDIPEVFLRGAGLDDSFINYVLSRRQGENQYHSCFISYSSKDQSFAERLYADLQNNNVRCWYAPEDLKIGDKFRIRIDESIRLYDKLLLVLSEHSLASNWVAYEVEKALNKEPEGTPNVLFPIRLDNTILTCETDWARDIRKSRHIGDFEHWKDHDAYQQAFQRLLRDLKAQS